MDSILFHTCKVVKPISGVRQLRSTQSNSLLNCVLRCPFWDQLRVEAISGVHQLWSTQGNSLLNCVLRCPFWGPTSRGGIFNICVPNRNITYIFEGADDD